MTEIQSTSCLWAGGSPLSGKEAAWIPADQLDRFRFALPSRGARILVLEGDGADSAAGFLEHWGYDVGRIESADPCPESSQWRLWSVPEILLHAVLGKEPGRAVCFGCGAGREAVYLASLGWSVTAVDRLPDALDLGRALERMYSGLSIEWVCADAVDYAQSLGQEVNLMTSLMYFDPRLIEVASRTVNKGLTSVFQTYSAAYQKRTGRPRNRNLVLQKNHFLGVPVPNCDFQEGETLSHLIIRLPPTSAAGL